MVTVALTIAGAALVLLAAAASWTVARAALAACHEPSRALAAAVATAYFAVVPAEVARVVDDLRVGLAVATLIAALVALALRRHNAKAPPPPTDTTTSTSTPTPSIDAPAPSSSGTRLVTPATIVTAAAMACLFALVAACAFRGNFYDEPIHWPTILQIARGVVPPRIVVEPDTIHHYHWGFDAVAAALVDAGLDVENAEDVAQCASFALLLAVAWVLGARLGGGRVAAGIVAVGVPLASSPLLWPLVDLGPLSLPSPYPARWSEPLQIAQPPAMFFFQHPQGFAMPLFLAVLLVFLDDKRRPARRVVGAVFLGVVALANVVYFEALGIGLFAACLAAFARNRDARAFAADVGALLGALVVAVVLGGILAQGPPLELGHFFHDPWPLVVVHHLVAFGAPLVALPLLRRFGSVGVALIASAAACFVIPNVVVLRDIWDIVKLDNVASFAAGAGFFALVGLAVERRRRVALAAAAGALSIAFSLAWLVVTAVRAPAEMVFRPDVDAWRRAFSPLIPPYARVLTDDAALGAETGFFTPGFLLQSSTFDVYAYLHIDPAHAARAHDAWSRAITTLDRADLDALGVDYVLATRSLAARLTPDAKAALDDGARFEPVLAADDAVLFRVLR